MLNEDVKWVHGEVCEDTPCQEGAKVGDSGPQPWCHTLVVPSRHHGLLVWHTHLAIYMVSSV